MTSKNRNPLTLEKKISIIHKLEINEDQASIVKSMNIPRSVVSRIWVNRKILLESYAKLPGNYKKRRSSSFPIVEEKLLLWFKEQREKNIPISGPFLIVQANKIAANENMNNFICTSSWISRFRKRNSITYGMIVGESGSVDMITVSNWLNNLWPLIRLDYEDCDIFNADETGLFYKCLPNRTLKFKNEKCSNGKLSKERLSILLCASMLGEKKKPLIIGKSKAPRCFKNKNVKEFNYVANSKAWMTGCIFKEELFKWDSELRSCNRSILLLIDNCTSHPDINVILTNIRLEFLPKNTTSMLQPLDQGVIKNQSYGKKERLNFSVLDSLRLIHSSWDRVTPFTIRNCFHHAGIIGVDHCNQPLESEQITTTDLLLIAKDFFDDEEEVNEYMNIDVDVIATEIYTDTVEEVSNEEIDDVLINDVSVEDALNAIKSLDTFYNFNISSSIINEAICQIRSDLNDKYLISRLEKK